MISRQIRAGRILSAGLLADAHDYTAASVNASTPKSAGVYALESLGRALLLRRFLCRFRCGHSGNLNFRRKKSKKVLDIGFE